jgi:PPOX class probable F420-dependent enzyme
VPSPKVEIGPRVRRHLENDKVIWLTTAGRQGRPHSVPVWFWWDGESFLVYSLPGQKVEDVRASPLVELHLNTDPSGDFVVRFDAQVELLPDAPRATRVPRYIAKYRADVKRFGWTTKYFADTYNVAMRIRPTRIRA